MTTETVGALKTNGSALEYATFYLGDLLLGIDIHKVQEINRHLEATQVPHAPEYVHGVVNLRGEVVTVLNLRRILELEPREISSKNRNVIVNSGGEQIGLLIDQIADVVSARTSELDPPPANLHGIDGRFFSGVYKLDGELLVILDIDELLMIRGTGQSV